MTALTRSLGTRGAVLIGLSSMVGAGAFVSLGGAYAVAGPLVLASVGLALAVAWANATSTAQLSAQYPSSGGTYVFGRKQLGPWWGFIAGWGFVVGKTASCAAMALVVASYVTALFGAGQEGGGPWTRALAVLLVVAVTGVNLVGITRTTQVAAILLAIAVTALLLTAGRVALALAGGVEGRPTAAGADPSGALAVAADIPASVPGLIQGAAIMFFAFAGYARVATLGEEVKEPRRTIPRAIMLALWLVAALYLLLGAVATWALRDPAVGARVTITDLTSAPFAAILQAVGAGPVWIAVVGAGAVCAGTGALLALVAGISRTALAMAREGDLPEPLAQVDPARSVPQRAQIVAGLAIALLALSGNTLLAVEFSSLGVLTYYFVANVSAVTQRGQWRLAPRAVNVFGAAACATLVLSLPLPVILVGLAVFAAGVIYRLVSMRVRRASA